MITTMIVEDERLILKDILNIIDWKKEGFDIVATAHNGKLGLSLFNQYRPQLVLTDIRMPIIKPQFGFRGSPDMPSSQ